MFFVPRTVTTNYSRERLALSLSFPTSRRANLNWISNSYDNKMAASGLKPVVLSTIASKYPEVQRIGQFIWSNPELGYDEHKASKALTDILTEEGFDVKRLKEQLETAFVATFGTGRPTIAFICEYDALPDIGHACGHNLIAAAGLTAGIGLKAAIEAGDIPGSVAVVGTPAEEGGGGKAVMINENCFPDVDVAMMVHPAAYSDAFPDQYLAICTLEVTYHGRACHASDYPWEGVNALDAAMLAYSSVSNLRQQMKPSYRVHGIVTKGGTKPNIIPRVAQLCYYIRAPTREELSELRPKVEACFHAAAQATGCTVDVKETAPQYDNLCTNHTVAKLFVSSVKSLGVNYPDSPTGALCGSTDMGNVSHIVPSIHPKYCIGAANNHTSEFTAISNTPEAYHITQNMGTAMALTGLEILLNPEVLTTIKSEVSSISNHC